MTAFHVIEGWASYNVPTACIQVACNAAVDVHVMRNWHAICSHQVSAALLEPQLAIIDGDIDLGAFSALRACTTCQHACSATDYIPGGSVSAVTLFVY